MRKSKNIMFVLSQLQRDLILDDDYEYCLGQELTSLQDRLYIELYQFVDYLIKDGKSDPSMSDLLKLKIKFSGTMNISDFERKEILKCESILEEFEDDSARKYLSYLISKNSRAIDIRELIIALNFNENFVGLRLKDCIQLLRNEFGVTNKDKYLEKTLSVLSPDKSFSNYQLKPFVSSETDKKKYNRIKKIFDSGDIVQYFNSLRLF